MSNMVDSFKKIMEDFIEKNTKNFLEIWKVDAVNESEFTVNISNPNFKKSTFSDVPLVGVGLGNFTGIMKLPQDGDLVIVGYLSENRPIVLGSIFGNYSNADAQIPQIKKGETFINNKKDGSYIIIKDDGKIILRAISNSIASDPTKTVAILLNPDTKTVTVEAETFVSP